MSQRFTVSKSDGDRRPSDIQGEVNQLFEGDDPPTRSGAEGTDSAGAEVVVVLKGRQGEKSVSGVDGIRRRRSTGLEEGKALAMGTTACHITGQAAKWKRAVCTLKTLCISISNQHGVRHGRATKKGGKKKTHRIHAVIYACDTKIKRRARREGGKKRSKDRNKETGRLYACCIGQECRCHSNQQPSIGIWSSEWNYCRGFDVQYTSGVSSYSFACSILDSQSVVRDTEPGNRSARVQILSTEYQINSPPHCDRCLWCSGQCNYKDNPEIGRQVLINKPGLEETTAQLCCVVTLMDNFEHLILPVKATRSSLTP
ncbi:hypothetical protein EXN66_Car005814 [Channa argus]|uniref:Uncharacterized protein n=1 Tax=Channa argus TaxID=215402 RepID=A0A6G1PIS0_CHAAH|nr:hypothetical protein EXN66_Car005814 [Channa argus]